MALFLNTTSANLTIAGRSIRPGQRLELTDEQADYFVRRGLGELVQQEGGTGGDPARSKPAASQQPAFDDDEDGLKHGRQHVSGGSTGKGKDR